RRRRSWRSAITAAAACRWRCSSKSRASSACTTSWGASMPGLAPSTRPFPSTRILLFSALAFPLAAAAEDLLQVYRDAQAYHAVYAAARHNLVAGREKLPQGRALLLPALNVSAEARTASAEHEPREQ